MRCPTPVKHQAFEHEKVQSKQRRRSKHKSVKSLQYLQDALRERKNTRQLKEFSIKADCYNVDYDLEGLDDSDVLL
eukprot:5311-Amphidinium_carterae.1